jgi:hypothetical protein
MQKNTMFPYFESDGFRCKFSPYSTHYNSGAEERDMRSSPFILIAITTAMIGVSAPEVEAQSMAPGDQRASIHAQHDNRSSWAFSQQPKFMENRDVDEVVKEWLEKDCDCDSTKNPGWAEIIASE